MRKHERKGRRTVRLGFLVALVGTLTFLLSGSAQAYIYWASFDDDRIGRANNDGSGVDPNFIATGDGPFAVAVNGSHIYWANQNSDSIGRANIDGTGIDNNFIPAVNDPNGIAVGGSFIFWSSLDDVVGRANLDGSSPNPSLISTVLPCGVAVDSGHVYWVSPDDPSTIGRAPLSGTPATQNFVTIPGTSFPCGVAVNTANIFWSDAGFFGGGTNIGRANVNTGMGADASTIGDASTPCGVAVDASHLYWANSGTSTIGRANTDSTGVKQDFVTTGGHDICGVAVDALAPPPPPSNAFTIGKLKRNKKKGSATLSVNVPGPGTLDLGGKGVKPQRPVRLGRGPGFSEKPVAGAGAVDLPIKATGKKRKKLKKRGKVKVTAQITFTPTGGVAANQSKVVKLIKRR